MKKLSQKYNEAYMFATDKHKNQFRKSVKVPYIVHLYEVAQILRENGADEPTIIAGILHDTVEDTGTKLAEIEYYFGKEVATLVDYCTEIKSMPYVERKKEHAKRLLHAPLKAKMVKCADCLSNLKSIYLDTLYDDNIWNIFNSSKENIEKHYAMSIMAFKELEGFDMYDQLKKYYLYTFGKTYQAELEINE